MDCRLRVGPYSLSPAQKVRGLSRRNLGAGRRLISMKFAGTLAAGLLLGAAPAFAQSVPKERSEIAYPGRAEPLGERVLATSRQQRRRKLRLEAERGRPLLPDHRQKHHLPAGRRAPDRQLSAHKGIPWRADNPKGSGCSVIGLGVDKDGNFLFGDWCSGRLGERPGTNRRTSGRCRS